MRSLETAGGGGRRSIFLGDGLSPFQRLGFAICKMGSFCPPLPLSDLPGVGGHVCLSSCPSQRPGTVGRNQRAAGGSF